MGQFLLEKFRGWGRSALTTRHGGRIVLHSHSFNIVQQCLGVWLRWSFQYVLEWKVSSSNMIVQRKLVLIHDCKVDWKSLLKVQYWKHQGLVENWIQCMASPVCAECFLTKWNNDKGSISKPVRVMLDKGGKSVQLTISRYVIPTTWLWELNSKKPRVTPSDISLFPRFLRIPRLRFFTGPIVGICKVWGLEFVGSNAENRLLKGAMIFPLHF